MRRGVLTICFAVLLYLGLTAQSYGLKFNSHETVPEKRTSLELAPADSLSFLKNLKLDFDLNFVPGHSIYFGYVLRVINGNQNIDIIYDQSAALFRVIDGQKFSGISFSLDSSNLFYGWNTISLFINRPKQQISVSVNDKLCGTAPVHLSANKYKFLWGANDCYNYQTRDIPPMRIKDIKLYDENTLKYYWSLNETAGNTSNDALQQKKAAMKNAVWIRPAHREWSLVNSFSVKGNAVVAFDKKTETLYIAGSDSIITYTTCNVDNSWKIFPFKHTEMATGSQAIFDTLTNKLYDVFIDEKKVIAYQPGSSGWNDQFHKQVETEYGHADKFISPLDTAIYVIGGYGQMKYKNAVQRYSIPRNTWEELPTKGDFFPPRYLSALGVNAAGDTAFIIGGYGSASGNQMLNPGNYSDMYAFDVHTRSFKKLFNLDTVFSKFTFANSLVIDSKKQEYYGLIFPNDSFNSNLQLIQGSLNNSTIKKFGNVLPYLFYDAQSFADLYYSPKAGKLVVVTLFGPKFQSAEKATTVKVYTINFPPELVETTTIAGPAAPKNWYVGALIALLVAALIVFGLNRRKKKTLVAASLPVVTKEQLANETERENIIPQLAPLLQVEQPRKPAVFLFGQFQAFDHEGTDVTELFTPLIRELFLLILISTFRNGRGITSEELNEILWSTKSHKDAKNNRSVNIAKLKSILEKVGQCTVGKKANFWQLQADDNFYIDYVHFTQLMKEKGEIGHSFMQQLLKITGNGPFLFQTEYNWLDNVKAEISNSIIDVSLTYINNLKNIYNEAEFVIEIANCIFNFDQLNEDALEYKCKCLIYLKRHALANKTFTKFQKDYRDMYGNEFEKSFPEIVKNDSPSQLNYS